MAKSHETWNKKEAEKKKQKKRKDKEAKKEERKANAKEGKTSLDEMMAYVDEYGNISSTPPDPTKKIVIKEEDIEIGIPRNEMPARWTSCARELSRSLTTRRVMAS